MTSRASPICQLYRSFRRCEGERLLQHLRELEQPHGLLQTNIGALHAALPQNSLGERRLPLAEVPLGRTERRILREFERALHGFFASTATLDASMRTVATSARRSRALLHSCVWHGTARDFIRGPGPDIDPQALMEPHAPMWSTLYEWFVRQAKAMHRVELDERNSLWDQLWWELRRPTEEESSQ